MHRPSGQRVVDVEDKTKAKEIVTKWQSDLFGGSQCRHTKKPQTNTIILKNTPLTHQMHHSGIPEDQLKNYVANLYPGQKIYQQRHKPHENSTNSCY